jgi:hypothetical protein
MILLSKEVMFDMYVFQAIDSSTSSNVPLARHDVSSSSKDDVEMASTPNPLVRKTQPQQPPQQEVPEPVQTREPVASSSLQLSEVRHATLMMITICNVFKYCCTAAVRRRRQRWRFT